MFPQSPCRDCGAIKDEGAWCICPKQVEKRRVAEEDAARWKREERALAALMSSFKGIRAYYEKGEVRFIFDIRPIVQALESAETGGRITILEDRRP